MPAGARQEPRIVCISHSRGGGNEQGNIVLKNILTAGNSEASDGGVGRPAGGSEITAHSRSSNGRKFGEGCREGGRETDVPLGVM
jgi:hypothetical protein